MLKIIHAMVSFQTPLVIKAGVSTSTKLSVAGVKKHKSLLPLSILAGALLYTVSVATFAQNLRIMPMGDSITEGVGAPSGNSYRGALYDRLINEVTQLDYIGNSRDGNLSDLENEAIAVGASTKSQASRLALLSSIDQTWCCSMWALMISTAITRLILRQHD